MRGIEEDLFAGPSAVVGNAMPMLGIVVGAGEVEDDGALDDVVVGEVERVGGVVELVGLEWVGVGLEVMEVMCEVR